MVTLGLWAFDCCHFSGYSPTRTLIDGDIIQPNQKNDQVSFCLFLNIGKNPHFFCRSRLTAPLINLNSRLNDNNMLTILLVFSNCIAVQTFPVFTFDDLLDASETPSFASLVANVQLPETFIVCSSSKEASFGKAPVYSIFGEDLSEWLTMVIQVIWGKTRLTIYWDGGFYHAGDLQNPKLEFWYHTCLKIDLSKKEIDCSVNGVLFSKFVGINITDVPKNLIMNIGVGRGQFRGSVANIQVFKKGDIKEISAAPCKDREGTLLSWNPQLWRVTGPH